MPQDTVSPRIAVVEDTGSHAADTPEFPADTKNLVLSRSDFAAGGVRGTNFLLNNPHHAVLHVRLSAGAKWLQIAPSEIALGPGEQQRVAVETDTGGAKAAIRAGEPPVAGVQLVYQRLFPTSRQIPPSPPGTGTIFLRLPLAACPSCDRPLDDETVSEGAHFPEVCPTCFERLRPCPVCGAPNSWLANVCILDARHVIRATPNWGTLGGGADHAGARAGSVTGLSRRWSYPGVAPSRRENALAWSAPVAAYGLVAAAATTTTGEAHIYAFDAMTGAPLWEPYPISDPVYPERGGVSIAGGKLFAATVEGRCVALDVLRGTRLWERDLGGKVYGAVVPESENASLLVATAEGIGTTAASQSGTLYVLEPESGEIRYRVSISGAPMFAPAASMGLAFVHDNSGAITAIDLKTGNIRWAQRLEAGANGVPGEIGGAPVVRENRVYTVTLAGMVFCHQIESGELLWQTPVTNSPLSGTPAHDGTLLYVPGDDALHLVSGTGKAVRRYGMRQPVRSAPVIVGNTPLFCGQDGQVYSATPSRGLESLYETGTGSRIIAAPALADNALFIVATNGVLYALTLQP